jgi:hypothetical protein
MNKLGYVFLNLEGSNRLPDDPSRLAKKVADGSGINVLAVGSRPKLGTDSSR